MLTSYQDTASAASSTAASRILTNRISRMRSKTVVPDRSYFNSTILCPLSNASISCISNLENVSNSTFLRQFPKRTQINEGPSGSKTDKWKKIFVITDYC